MLKIKFVIIDFVSADHQIPIPRRSRRRSEIPLIQIQPLFEDTEGYTHRFSKDVQPDFTIHDLPLDGKEKSIVYMLDQGYSKNEIAEELEVSRRIVYGIIDKIRVKVKEWCNVMQITY